MIRQEWDCEMRQREQREEQEPFVQRTGAVTEVFAEIADDGAMVVRSEVEDGDPTTMVTQASLAPGTPTSSGASERADIARRVMAFRDRQRLIRQQREDYCNAVQAETRAALRGGWEIPRG